MADDLASLQQYGTFQDEDEMRIEVAARVVANSSRAALDDEEKLKRCWRALEQAEHAVSALELELGEATLAAQQRETAVAVVKATRGDASDGAATAPRRVSDIRFQLNTTLTEMKRADAAVRQTQKEVDRRQAARLAEAKQKEREHALADQQQQRQRVVSAGASMSPTATSATGRAATSLSNNNNHDNGHASRAPVPKKGTAATPASPVDVNVASPTTASDSAVGSPTARVATRVLYRVPTHLKGVTQSDYSGGEVLPSLSRVQVTRADIRAKQRRYQDDSDMMHYVERIAKRQRLEALANHQRRLAAHAEDEEMEEESNGTVHRSATPTMVRVKQEPASSTAPTTARHDASAQPKKEEQRHGENETKTIKLEVDKVESDAQLQRVLDDAEDSVIDVDALMEDDDDAAVAAAMHRATTHLHHHGGTSSGASTPAVLSQPSQHVPSRLSLKDEVEEEEGLPVSSGSGDLVLEMEEVTVLPGVRMDASIYSRLLDYQQEGLLWLLSLHARRSGGILGDEMGLGKTIQTAALVNALHHSCLLRGPVLIVSPMTVLRQWLAELHRWAPYVRSCVMHESSGSEASREALLRSVQGTPAVVVTTFSAMRDHCAVLQRTGFQYIILDEGHKISNPEAGVTLAAKSFTTPHRLILSGSPIQNSLKELWCLFDFVRPGLLGTMNRFIDEFETPIAQSRNVRASPLSLATAVECAKTLQAHIAPYLLRRLKRQVSTKLPPKYERVLRVPLTDEQLEQYLQVLSSPVVQRLFAQTVMYGSRNGGLDRDFRDSTGSLHVGGARLNMATRRNNSGVRLESFRLMNQLRQVCNHADIYAVQKGADEEDRMLLSRRSAAAAAGRGPLKPGQHRSFRSNNPVNLHGSGKLNALLMMLKEWKSFGHRVLVFSQTRMLLDIVENLCEQQSYSYIRMDGATNGHHRQELMDRFNEDDTIFVALLTTRVGGIGVNLVGADRVVIFDPDWNPITDVQARERAWRIGQKREVCVYRLITSGTVEEAILRRQLAKMYVTDKVLKDPELQRFFHVQDSFMENFLLGSEYESRVPMDKRYLLAAHQLHTSSASSPVSASGGSPTSRRNRIVDNTLGDYGGGVPGEDDEDFSTSSSSNDDCETESEVQVKVEGVDVDADVDAEHHTDSKTTPAATKKPKKERDFGMLMPIKNENSEDDAPDGRPIATTSSSTALTAAANGKAKESSETQLLQSLVDQQDITVAGNDRVAHRLARKKAEGMLQRLASGASVMETMREQQKQFSLLHALEEKKAKEAAERAEQRQYFREETAAAAAAKRRREE